MNKMYQTILELLNEASLDDNLRLNIADKRDYHSSDGHEVGWEVIGVSNSGIIYKHFGYQYGVEDWQDCKNNYLILIHTDIWDNDSVVKLIDCGELEKIK
jgi:hypothetical protein